jgi:predicted RNase H-like nuclease
VDPRPFLGVDRAGGAWLAVGYGGGDDPAVGVYNSMADLWADHGDRAERVVVDVPVGLLDLPESDRPADDRRTRACDDRARAVVGPRSSSVFPAPSRPAVAAAVGGESHEAVSDRNRAVTGTGLSARARALASAIDEVDRFLREGPGDPEVVVEGHPELCFRAFAVDHLAASKHSAVGVVERMRALRPVPEYGHGDWVTLADRLRDREENAGFDDLFDALALALTAAAPAEAFRRLPPDPPTDDAGLPMQMVYRRDEAFAVE